MRREHLILTLSALFALAWGCSSMDLLPSRTPRLGEAKVRSLTVTAKEILRPVPSQEIHVRSMVGGVVGSVPVKAGQHVEEGEVLVVLAEEKLTENLSRLDQESFPQEGLREFLERWTTHLDVKAPTAGTIRSVHVKEGSEIGGDQSVLPTQAVVTMIPDSASRPLYVVLRDVEHSGVTPGAEAIVTLDTTATRVRTGSIGDFEVPEGSAVAAKVPILLADPPDLAWHQRAKVDVHEAEDRECLTVPVESVFRKVGRDVVFVWSGRSFAEREVTIGLSDPFLVEILSGVGSGDKVALDDPTLPPGFKVKRL